MAITDNDVRERIRASVIDPEIGLNIVDLGLIYGIGFPPFRGGALRYIDSIGVAEFVALHHFAQSDGDDHFVSASPDGKLDPPPRMKRHFPLDLHEVVDFLAVERDDPVAGPEPRVAGGGHFGENAVGLPWEWTDIAEVLQKEILS